MSELLEAGLAHHRAGRLEEAEACYRRLLAETPEHPDGLHLLGLIAHASGRIDDAIMLLRRAIMCAPGNPVFRCNLAISLRDAGRSHEARGHYELAVRFDPSYFDAWSNLSVVLMELNEPEAAVAACDRALALRPEHAAAHTNRGNAWRALRRWDAALRDYDAALRLNPGLAVAHANRGLTLGELDHWGDAADSLSRAIALDPDNAEFHYGYAITLRVMGLMDAALRSYDQTLRLNPEHAGACANRANVLAELGRIEEALDGLDAGIRQRPDDAGLLYNRAVMRERLNRFAPAVDDYEKALSAWPDFPDCAHNLGLINLLLGRFRRGWPLYELRFRTPLFLANRRDFAEPRWRGEPLRGRTLLIHAEQGSGDTIQFCRYAALIGGGRVIMEVQRALTRLLAGLPGVDQLIGANEPPPRFDLQCPMLSLPSVFGTDAETIPPPARLTGIGPAVVPASCDGPKIGIVWSGNPDNSHDPDRSMRLATLLPLLEPAGLLCALQPLMSEADRETLRATPAILDLGRGFRDFADTAAAILALDLVISVDTAVAHLSATLGRPTWILLPYRPNWRWQLDRCDSPWYPAARLFRQTSPGEWDGVIGRVMEALREGRLFSRLQG